MSITVTIKGFDVLQKEFKNIPKKMQREVSEEFRNEAKEIRDAIKKDAPVDIAQLKNSTSYSNSFLSI